MLDTLDNNIPVVCFLSQWTIQRILVYCVWIILQSESPAF